MRTTFALLVLLAGSLCAQKVFPPIPASGPGSGSVTNVDGSAGNGVETVQGGAVAAITTSGSVRASSQVVSVTGTTYTILTTNRGKTLVVANDAGVAVALPAAGVSFPTGWFTDLLNNGVGAVTLTPASGTIDGASVLALTTQQSVRIVSDGTNYHTLRGLAPPAVNPPPTPGYTPNQCITGCGVQYTSSGLIFTVGVSTYLIAGVQYSSAQTDVTLTAADPTLNRFDAIVLDSSGVATFVTGTAAASPLLPTVDQATQFAIAYVSVPAAATTPANIVVDTLYDEGSEWTLTLSANLTNSTSNPYHLTHDIEATSAVLTRSFTLVKPAAGTLDLSTRNNLIFYIRSKAAWPTGNGGANARRNLTLQWLNGATLVGASVVIQDGTFGFNSSQTTSYQQLQIPLTLFGTGSNAVTTLRGTVTGNTGSSSIGFYLDWITVQGGLTNITLPTTLMNFKGTWNALTSYSRYDTVVSGGLGYVALAANTNVAVSTAATWEPLANVTNIAGNAATASALDHTPTSCTSGQFVSGVSAAVLLTCGVVTDAQLSTSDVTTNNVTSTKHGFAPKSPADATKFLNGAAIPDYAFVKDSDLSTTDITTNNASITKHGFVPKLPNDATKFYNGVGDFVVINTTVPHPFGAVFDGGGVTLLVGKTAYFPLPYGCTIQAYTIWADTGNVTMKLWKVATGGTALPTVANVISISGWSIPANQKFRSTTLTDLTTSTVTANDFGAVTLTAVTSATQAGLTVECQ